MKCFNCEQYTPMGYIYSMKISNRTYNICTHCISKALGEPTIGFVRQPKKERDKQNLRFYHKVIDEMSKYEPMIF